MARSVKNFDEFRKQDVEKRGHPYVLFGKEGHLPPTIPVGLVLMYKHLDGKADDEEVPDSDIVNMLTALFGKETVDYWVSQHDFDIDLMSEVLKWAFSIYGLTKEDGVEESEEEKIQAKKGKVLHLKQ